MRIRSIPFCVFSIFLVSLAAHAQNAMTNDDVIALVKGGLGSEVIIAKIRASSVKFDTSTAALIKLAQSGVADRIVAAMVDKDTADKSTLSDVPETGSLRELKDKQTFYLYTEPAGDQKAIERITREMAKGGFAPVGKLEDADFAIQYRQWIDRDGTTTIGVLEAFLLARPSGAFRRRSVYSIRKTQITKWTSEPADATVRQFIKDLKSVK